MFKSHELLLPLCQKGWSLSRFRNTLRSTKFCQILPSFNKKYSVFGLKRKGTTQMASKEGRFCIFLGAVRGEEEYGKTE